MSYYSDNKERLCWIETQLRLARAAQEDYDELASLRGVETLRSITLSFEHSEMCISLYGREPFGNDLLAAIANVYEKALKEHGVALEANLPC